MPRFSVIVPFYNASSTLIATIESILSQTFTDWEAIFVNDRSTDESAQIVARYAANDARVTLYENIGTGPSDARNFAASIAAGEYLSFCDADDLWTTHRLSELDKEFRDTHAQGLYGRIGFFRHQPGDGPTQSTVLAEDLAIKDLLGENPVCTMSNLTIHAASYQQSGGLNTRIVHNEDLEFLIRFIGEGYRIKGVDSLHVWYRTNPTGLSSDLSAMLDGRQRAVACARRFGADADPAQEAIYMRYLARRALRLDNGTRDSLRFTVTGIRHDARAFLHPLRRGGMTAIASVIAPVLPRRIRHSLFSH